ELPTQAAGELRARPDTIGRNASRARRPWLALRLLSAVSMSLRPWFVVLIMGCGSSPSATVDSGAIDVAAPDAPIDGPSTQTVTFTYTPAWDGVQSVDVIGAFGQANDWTAPLVTLANSGGAFSGTASLAPGQYLYLFHVVGDAAAGTRASTAQRFVIDP